MGILTWAEEKMHKLTIWDWSVIKIVLILLGMIIGAYVATFVQQYVLYFIIVVVVGYVIIIARVFRK